MAIEKTKSPKNSPYHVSRSVIVAKKRARARSNASVKSPVVKRKKKTLSHATKLALMPNRNNNYLPHLIRRYGLIALAIFVVLFNVVYFSLRDGQVLGENMNITDSQLLSLTNDEREQHGLHPLKYSPELAYAAENKARDMINKDYWSHESPDGTTPWYWIESSGYKYSYAGENLARGFTTVDGIMNAWLESPTHRANVLNNNYTEVGFAAIPGEMNGKKTTLVVAMYGRPKIADAGFEQIAGTTTLEGQIETGGILTHIRRGMQSLAPSLTFILVVLGIAASIAVLAHYMHWKLSPKWARTLRLHHTLIKVCFIAILAVGSILSYGGGMI